MTCSWLVIYPDGTTLAEYDPDGTEHAFKEIAWYRNPALRVDSTEVTTDYELAEPTPGLVRSLRARSFMTLTGEQLRVLIVLDSLAGAEITAETVKQALYIFPDGSIHNCTHFDCTEIREVALRWVHGQPAGIMPYHSILQHEADSVLS